MPKQIGQRNTRQRDMIYNIISSAHGPVTVDEIYQSAQQQGPIGIATVYRTINLLLDNNKILKTTLSDGQSRYERSNKEKHHHHFLCRVCEKAICIDAPPILCAETNKQISGFIVESHELIVHGVCKPCSKK